MRAKSRRNPLESWMQRSWYLKGLKAAARRNWVDMYGAFAAVKSKASTSPGRFTEQQESFFQGYLDGQRRRGNPAPAQKKFPYTVRGVLKALRYAQQMQKRGYRATIRTLRGAVQRRVKRAPPKRRRR